VNWDGLLEILGRSGLNRWADSLKSEKDTWLVNHGDFARWKNALDELPDIEQARGQFDRAAVTVQGNCSSPELLHRSLQGLMPWRKGPFQFAEIFVDSEWRSDFKWERVLPHLASLRDRRIIDIGCGNGYYCWRMLENFPEVVLGIEPSVLFNLQFQAMKRYLECPNAYLLPIGVEEIPANLCWFDTAFSMGVLYHRKSPVEHLYQLKDLLVAGGELCLETLVIEGKAGQVLVPRQRYARMRNVWFIPSAIELIGWLTKCGFENARVVDESVTTINEQRRTPWMQFESLEQSLDPSDPGRTVEGLPAPHRAVIIARKPR